MNSAPVGIFGGTFDPIHHGHLRLAQEALEQCQLSEVRFIPSGTPPHRTAPRAAAAHRLAMVRLAIHGQAGFVLDDREAGRTDPCYSVDTFTALRSEVGEQPLCLLIGSDAFLQFHTWHEWQRLFELAHLIVIQRPGRPLGNAMADADPALCAQYQLRLAPSAAALREAPGGKIVVLDMPLLDISATDIRKRCSEHKNLRYLLPDSVNQYIHTHHLYTSCSL